MNKNIEELDDLLQSMSLSELRAMETKKVPIVLDLEDTIKNGKMEIDEYVDIDEYIQNLQVSELKKLVENSISLHQINQHILEHKAQITGLDKKVIFLIEYAKEKATLQQIITYCTKLHIPFRQFLPELF